MQRYRREWIPGATYFITVNTYRRQNVLIDRPFYQSLKSAFKEVKSNYPFDIEVFVLLLDHLHCIWKLLGNDTDYSVRWSLIKCEVSQKCKLYLHNNTAKSRVKRRELGL